MSVTIEDIQATNAYKGIGDSIAQNLIVNKSNRKSIKSGVVIALNIGLDRYKEVESPSGRVFLIVEELVNKSKNPN